MYHDYNCLRDKLFEILKYYDYLDIVKNIFYRYQNNNYCDFSKI